MRNLIDGSPTHTRDILFFNHFARVDDHGTRKGLFRHLKENAFLICRWEGEPHTGEVPKEEDRKVEFEGVEMEARQCFAQLEGHENIWFGGVKGYQQVICWT